MKENRLGVALNPGRGATPEEMGAFWFDGVVNTQGRVMNATADGALVEAGRSNLSPEYYRRFNDITSWADRYPHGDPRTWVPLVYAGVKADDFMASEVMTADYDQQQIRGLTGRPKGSGRPSGSVTPAEVAAAAEEAEGTGWLQSITGAGMDAAGWVGGKISGEGEQLGLGDIAVVGDIGRETAGLAKDVANTAAVKGVSRNVFAAGSMPAQAIVGSVGNIQDDLADGDIGMAFAHGFGANPVLEALFIGSENVTGTEWYRKGGKEQSNWSQTDMGQTILDITGQGRGEQSGAYDDPLGLQADQGSGLTGRSRPA